MNSALAHRGPDDSGVWVEGKLGFGHTRLSILDLSKEGHQPMLSHEGRWALTYNGEVYNFEELRAELKSATNFRGNSDTEVILECLSKWGLEKTVNKLNGMFAFAAYDRKINKLYFVVDRLGKKPLYYGSFQGELVFASELKALMALDDFDEELDPQAVCEFFRLGYIPAPLSIFKNIRKVGAAHYVEFDLNGEAKLKATKRYWNPLSFVNGVEARSENENLLRLKEVLIDSVRLRLRSDVALGSFLSGGVDSSLVTAVAQSLISEPVQSFSIGFSEKSYDESGFARSVAQHLGTDHHELIVTPRECMDVIPKIAGVFDEPFADSSQIPTFLVSQLARKNVTVALSGDGGDELFAGYNRYLWGERVSTVKRVPGARFAAGVLGSIPNQNLDTVLKKLTSILPKRLRLQNLADKIQKLIPFLNTNSADEVYFHLSTHWADAKVLLPNAVAYQQEWKKLVSDISVDSVTRMQLLDLMEYLPGDILTKVDRSSMAHSLEARCPLLDYRLVEFALGLPINQKISKGKTKWLLRKLLYEYVPAELVERPKTGFSIPLSDWLRGPLKEWTHDTLAPLKKNALFDSAEIESKLNEHMSGLRSWSSHLWDLLVFQMCLENFKSYKYQGISKSPSEQRISPLRSAGSHDPSLL